LRYVLSELSKVELRALDVSNRLAEKLKAERYADASVSFFLSEAEDVHRTYVEYEQAVRDAFFTEILGIKKVADDVEDSLKLYERYERMGRLGAWFYVSLSAAFAVGVLVPLFLRLLGVMVTAVMVAAVILGSLVPLCFAMLLVFRQYR